MKINVMRLVSAPPPAKRSCGYCGAPMSPIELWHGCPERRLARVVHVLQEARMRRREATMKRDRERARARVR